MAPLGGCDKAVQDLAPRVVDRLALRSLARAILEISTTTGICAATRCCDWYVQYSASSSAAVRSSSATP